MNMNKGTNHQPYGAVMRITGIIALLCCRGIFSAENIAVSDLTGQGVDQPSAVIITDRMRTELFNSGAFTVLERQAMQDILKEQGFQQTGCVSDQCMVEMGQLLGVSRIVSGTVGKLGQLFTINIRMVDVATGRITYSTSVDCKCAIEDVLIQSVPALARRMAAGAGVSVKEPAPVRDVPKPVAPAGPRFGSLAVSSDPMGAQVALDGKNAGITPFTMDSIEPGEHKVKLSLMGYDEEEGVVTVVAGRLSEKRFGLEHSRAWKDSVKQAEKAARAVAEGAAPKKRKSPVPKVLWGIGALAGAGAGVLFNSMVQGAVDEDARLKNEYLALNDPARAAEYQTKLDDAKAAGGRSQLLRTGAYIVGGACAVGFAVSFAF